MKKIIKNTVYFRSFEPEDADAIYKWFNDDELKQNSIGLNKRICKEEALDWVKAHMFNKPYEIWWAICSKENDKIIGYTNLDTIHFINRSAHIGGIVIGEKEYQDGFAWIESLLFVFEYAFERLNLNRVYSGYIDGYKRVEAINWALFFEPDARHKEAIFKNGAFHDRIEVALLARDYYNHKSFGDYELKSIIKRIVQYKKENRTINI